jgi:hypothetical protein
MMMMMIMMYLYWCTFHEQPFLCCKTPAAVTHIRNFTWRIAQYELALEAVHIWTDISTKAEAAKLQQITNVADSCDTRNLIKIEQKTKTAKETSLMGKEASNG